MDVTYKPIKNIHLRVHHSDGRVSVSAPRFTSTAQIEGLIRQKRSWIDDHRQRITATPPPATVAHPTHGSMAPLWGHGYRLEFDPSQRATIHWDTEVCRINTAEPARVTAILNQAYLAAVKSAMPALLAKWQPQMGVQVQRVFVQRMRARWGSCTYQRGYIRLNSELAKYPPTCLEYVVVHELVHLLEPSHNARFYALQLQFMPDFKTPKAQLDRSNPLAHPQQNA